MGLVRTPDGLILRAGRLADLPAVESFTQNTFHWGDYLPRAWPGWVSSRRGQLLVAELDGLVVGTIHVQSLGEGEAWLEGVRVRPEFRGRGIASQMIRRAHELAAVQANHVIRLETGAHNVAARAMITRHGYHLLLRYGDWEAEAAKFPSPLMRPATARDLAVCLSLWEHSPFRRAARGLVPADYGWRWWCFTPTRLERAIREGRVWVTPVSGAVKAFMVTRKDDALPIPLVVGPPGASASLLAGARALALSSERQVAFWLAPFRAAARTRAALAGYELDDDDLLIYERAL